MIKKERGLSEQSGGVYTDLQRPTNPVRRKVLLEQELLRFLDKGKPIQIHLFPIFRTR